MARKHPDWKPDLLRMHREEIGLTLEDTGEKLREIAERHGFNIAANFQTIWGHEKGSVYPGPHYRRAYCRLYRCNEAQLGFRKALPGEDPLWNPYRHPLPLSERSPTNRTQSAKR